jgi:hypothetical protein
MSRNSGSKYVNKVKSIIVYDLVNQKSYVDLVILQYDLSVLQYNLSMHVVFQIEAKANFLLCSKFVVVFLVLLFTTVHLFANLFLFVVMTSTLM